MNVLRVTQGLAEINHVHNGDLEVTGGTALLTGRVTGDVVVLGGRAVVSGIIDGNLDNRGGRVLISGTVLGTISGSPAYTVVEPAQIDRADPFATWDPIASTSTYKRVPSPVTATKPAVLRERLWTSLTTAAVVIATISALAAVGDNAAVADAITGDGVAIIQVVEKPSTDN